MENEGVEKEEEGSEEEEEEEATKEQEPQPGTKKEASSLVCRVQTDCETPPRVPWPKHVFFVGQEGFDGG